MRPLNDVSPAAAPWLAHTARGNVDHGTTDGKYTLCHYVVSGQDERTPFHPERVHSCRHCAKALGSAQIGGSR